MHRKHNCYGVELSALCYRRLQDHFFVAYTQGGVARESITQRDF